MGEPEFLAIFFVLSALHSFLARIQWPKIVFWRRPDASCYIDEDNAKASRVGNSQGMSIKKKKKKYEQVKVLEVWYKGPKQCNVCCIVHIYRYILVGFLYFLGILYNVKPCNTIQHELR